MKNGRKTILKTCIITTVLFAVSCSTMIAATGPKADNDKIVHYIIDQLSYDENEKLLYSIWGPVSQGDTILMTNGPLFDIPCRGYVMYIDLYPMANLFHPVQYVFLAEQTKELMVFDATNPPLNFHEYSIIETTFSHFFYSVENRRANIPSKTTSVLRLTRQDSRWAVLMNGGYDQSNNHVRYWNDLSNIYITLNSVYEIPDENIIVLCSDGLNPAVDQSNGQNSNTDLDGDGDADIMYSCILSNVNMVFANLANNFTGNEKLFVFTTDHGSTVSGWNVVQNLWNHEVLTDAHFAELLAAFPECEIICTLEPCYSGGFLDNVVVAPGPIVASSACRHDESSWAMENLIYDEYVFHWTAAVNGEDAFGNPVDADMNEDGFVTMDEAFIYAEAQDTRPESPQYGEYPRVPGRMYRSG
ncbi:MAG TPA: C13 family peptidase [Candidatus Thermoplasmatota archaeon]|nr:C13 family peptidase [Candidatus Thermoplasmatota archaeon]